MTTRLPRTMTALRLATSALGLALLLATAAEAAMPPADRELVRRLVLEEAIRTPVPPALALALAKVQSDFQSNALSSRGARGVLQIMPETAQGEFSVDPEELWDPRLNIELGLDFLGRLFQRYGSWDLALAHYHAGSVDGQGSNAKPRPESQGFVDAVKRWQERYAAQADLWVKLRSKEALPGDRWVPAYSTAMLPGEPEITQPTTPVAGTGPEPRPRATIVWREPNRRAMVVWQEPARLETDPEWTDINARRAIARARMDDFSPPARWLRRP